MAYMHERPQLQWRPKERATSTIWEWMVWWDTPFLRWLAVSCFLHASPPLVLYKWSDENYWWEIPTPIIVFIRQDSLFKDTWAHELHKLTIYIGYILQWGYTLTSVIQGLTIRAGGLFLRLNEAVEAEGEVEVLAEVASHLLWVSAGVADRQRPGDQKLGLRGVGGRIYERWPGDHWHPWPLLTPFMHYISYLYIASINEAALITNTQLQIYPDERINVGL